MSDLLQAVARQRMSHVVEIRKLAPTPVAGAEVSIVVPGGEVWRVLGVRVSFLASAAVANRIPGLVLDNQTDIGAEITSATIFAAAATGILSWVADAGNGVSVVAGGMVTISIPPLIAPSGWRIRTRTINLDVADVYSAVTFMVERLDEPPELSYMTGTPEEEALHDALQHLRESET